MSGLKNILSLLLVLGFLSGFALAEDQPSLPQYRSVLKEWTRHKQWYSPVTMQAEMLWHATYFSPEFRHAQEQETIKRKYLDPVEASVYIAQQEKKQSAYEEFFVGLYTIKAYREFSLGKSSFWETVLVKEDGEEIFPVGIEPIEIRPFEKILYPYLGRWDKGYRVLFPKSNLNKFSLVLRSVVGETKLKWDSATTSKSHPLEILDDAGSTPGE